MKQLSKETKFARYDLKLPIATTSSRKIKNKGELNDIPSSMIANKLNESLVDLIGNIDIDIDIKIDDNKKADIISKTVCTKIISSFRCIYCKYINSNGAIFEINISSRNRNILRDLYDCNYYKRYQSINNDNKDKDDDDNVELKSIRLDSVDNNVKGTMSNYSMMNKKLDDYLLNSDNVNVSEYNLYKFVLSKIITRMEPSVYEISNLINDSYSRFINKNKKLYQKLSLSVSNI